MSNVDSRGNLRGRCSSCACDGYSGGSEKKKCIGCGHPPGRHQNLSTSSSVSSSSGVSSTSALSPPRSAIFNDGGLGYSSDGDSAVFMTPVYQCQYLGCQRETVFDPNTGAQKSYCQDHMLQHAQSSHARYDAFTTPQWSLGNTDSSDFASSQSDSSDNEQDQSSSSRVQSDVGSAAASNSSQSSANWGGGLANVLSSFLQFRAQRAPSVKTRPQQVDLSSRKRTQSLGVPTLAPARPMTAPLQPVSQPPQGAGR